MLALALCAVLLTLAYPLRQYLGQRAQIAAEVATQRATEQSIRTLGEEHASAADPSVIEAEARSRLHFTLPGERNYIVLVPVPVAKPTVIRHGHTVVPDPPGSTWYGRLWRSDVSAGAGK